MESSRGHIFFIMQFLAFTFALLIWFPALICSCVSSVTEDTEPEDSGQITERRITLKGMEEGYTLDIFIFHDDAQGKLDSYQRIEAFRADKEGQEITVASTKGNKRLVAIANSHRPREECAGIISYEGLSTMTSLLYDEDPACPTMHGEAVFTADGQEDVEYEVTLKPLAAEILLRSIRCDFKGREYAGKKLTDIKVYLTNVNAECRIMQDIGFTPEMTVNAGGFNSLDAEKFRYPEIIVQEPATDIGDQTENINVRLYCYPNESREETPGTIYTRLVVEGRIGERIWYYPIDINRDATGRGVGRNCSYTYDLTILRTGTSDPDTPVSGGTVIIEDTILPWEERNEEDIVF